MCLSMSVPKDPEHSPRRRAPGGGRKPGYSEPVTVVSISMDPSTLRQIDREALRAGRSRSAFVRWALRRICAELLQKREDVRLPPLKDPTHGGRFDPALSDGPDWTCSACECKTVAGWLVCPACGAPRGPI